jgi:HEAT repeat protein
MRPLIALVAAMMVLGCSRTPTMTTVHGKSLQHWLSAMGDRDAKARRRAAEVLGNVGTVDPAIVPALISTLKDRDPQVRAEAVLALVKIGPAAEEAVPALTQACNDRDARVRAHAVKALERVQKSR